MSTLEKKMALKNVFLSIRRDILEDHDYLPHIKIAPCYQADQEHAKSCEEASCRSYMHWGHKPNTICYAKAAESLSEANQRGLCWHEFGHVLDDLWEPDGTRDEAIERKLDKIEDDEERADEIIVLLFDVTIEYDKRNVQIVEETEPGSGSDAAKRPIRVG